MTGAARTAGDVSPTEPSADTAWFNCAAGVAGDMLLAALIDAGADRFAVIDAWSRLDLDGFAASWERVDRAGVSALWTNLVVDHDQHRSEDHDHAGGDHAGGHHSGGDHAGGDHAGGAHTEGAHGHRPARDVIAMIEAADLPDRVVADATHVYRALAATEGEIHGQPADEVELHEVGAVDSILDVVGVCAALYDLDLDTVCYSPIGIGAGLVRTAHGVLPHPAPATARLLACHRAPVTGIATAMETATPTGVALLTTLGVAAPAPPPIDVTAVGYGAGSANPADRANVVQVLVGTRRPIDQRNGDGLADELAEQLIVIETNVDDITAETIAYTIERLLDRGALDAWATPIVMKKGRAAHTVHALGRPSDLGALRTTIFDETGTLGARVRFVDRLARRRDVAEVTVDGSAIRIKVAEHRFKVEFEDAARAARTTGRPLRTVIAEAERAYRELERPR